MDAEARETYPQIYTDGHRYLITGLRVIPAAAGIHIVNNRTRCIMVHKDRVRFIVITTLLGGIASIIIGFIFYQGNIFVPRLALFTFVTKGFMIALFFSSLRSLPKKYSFLVLLLLYIVEIAGGPSFRPLFLLTRLLFILILGAVTYVYHRYFDVQKNIWFLRPLMLASLMAAGCIVIFIFSFLGPLLFATTSQDYYGLYISIALDYLIGLGTGYGIELSYYLLKRSKTE
jgi:hypothetical protein